jgi:HSP20 family protein
MTGRRELWEVTRFSGVRGGFRPQCDCYRTDAPAELQIVLELPGIDPDAVRIEANGGALIISGVRERPHPAGARYHLVEIEYGPFERRIELAEAVDADAVTTAYEDGMLRLEVPLGGLQGPPAKPPARGRETARRGRAGQ